MIVMYQCRFISGNKWTTLVEKVDNGASYTCVRARVCGKSLYLPLNFITALKDNSFFLKKYIPFDLEI